MKVFKAFNSLTFQEEIRATQALMNTEMMASYGIQNADNLTVMGKSMILKKNQANYKEIYNYGYGTFNTYEVTVYFVLNLN